MEKGILGLVELAKKSAEAEAGGHRSIKVLYKLRSISIKNETLTSTNVGKFVDSLTAHPRKEIKVLASSILTKWKRQLYRQMKKSNVDTKRTVKNQHSKSNESQKPVIRDPEVNQKTDCIPRSTNPLRNKIREEVFQALCIAFAETNKRAMTHQLSLCDPVRVAVSLESALFKNWGLSSSKCRNKYKSLLFNLKDPKNPEYRRKVLMGEMKPERVATLNAVDMAIPIRPKARTTIWL